MSASQPPPEGPRDRSEDVTRLSRYGPPAPPPGEPPRSSSGANGWMLALLALVALAVGVGLGLLIDSGSGDDAQVRTVHSRTTVNAGPATAPEAVTVTQPPRETTVIRTQTVQVTVTPPTTPTATQP